MNLRVAGDKTNR